MINVVHKGRAFEYKLKHWYEENGKIVLRMAGSHGFCDLVVIDNEAKTIYFIQLKARILRQKEFELEKEKMAQFIIYPFYETKTIVWHKGSVYAH